MKKIRVLIVDDSILFQKLIANAISSHETIEVIATAKDPYDARNKIIEFLPDVMTCDVEMPRMNGIDFIKMLMPQHPMPVVVVSSVSKAVLDAMAAGAVDFVTKPDLQSLKSVEAFINELIMKIKMASTANILHCGSQNSISNMKNITNEMLSKKIIAIGASTGGTEAISSIMKSFSKDIPGIVIVQHIPPVFSQMFADRLNNTTQMFVKEAQTGDYIERGKVLIAPGNKHMRIKKMNDKYMVECFEGDKVNGHCPSVDVLFESVAREAGKDAIGVILTGMGYDGAKGLLLMKRKGARTVGQDEQSCVVYGMPKVAYEIGGVDKQVSLNEMPKTILNMVR